MARGRPKKDVNMTQDLNKAEELALASVDLNALQPDETSDVLATPEGESVEPPSINSPEWTDYFLSFMAGKEMQDGKPKVTGLRRVVGLLIGEIVSSKPKTIQPPSFIHDGNSLKMQPAVVEYEVVIKRGGNDLLVFADVADASWLNCGGEYGKHPSAVASTRAEARALRKLAKLNVCSSEEIEGVPTEETSDLIAGGTTMKDEQVVFIDNLCRNRNMNVWKIINFGGHSFCNIKKVPEDVAKRAIRKASLLNQHPDQITEDLLGYDENWNK